MRAMGAGTGCAQASMRRAGRGLLRGAVGSLVAVALGPVGIAVAGPPHLTIESPRNGSVINNQTPKFKGTTDDEFDEVTLNIRNAEGLLVQQLTASSPPFSGAWSALAEALTDGSYTALATQTNPWNEEGESAPVTFTVDTQPPNITLTSPANGSSTTIGAQLVGGAAGTATGDSSAVTIPLFAGATIGAQDPLETLVVQASNGSWSATLGGLSAGTYTAQAKQRDEAGNTGTSEPVTFIITAPPSPSPPSPPIASFRSFPSAPQTGERVSLVSTSTDAASPITAFAWALTSNGAFSAGKPVLTTSFATSGRHVVRLRVTDTNGLSSVATETINVTTPAPILMQPFPIVRIAGSKTSYGAKVGLLTVQAPVASRVTVTCRGHGCTTKSESRVAVLGKSKSRARAVLLAFRRFERSLRAGVVLQIRVSDPGEIGKYTSFTIRRHKLPVRVDACVWRSSPKPIRCPAS